MKETVIRNVTDPNWWFTVIFAGLIVGLFANYLKDWTYRLFAHVSARFRSWLQLRNARREARITLLAEHAELLTIEYIRSVYRAVLCTMFFLTFLLMPPLGAAWHQFLPDGGGFAHGDPRLVPRLFVYASPICGLLAICLELQMLSRIRMCADARRRYERTLTIQNPSNNNDEDIDANRTESSR